MVNWKVITTARWLYDSSSHTPVVIWYLITKILISSLKKHGYMTTHHKISMRKWKVIIIYPGTCDTYHSITIRSKKSKFYDLIISSLKYYLINHQWLLGRDLCGTPTNLSKSTAPSTERSCGDDEGREKRERTEKRERREERGGRTRRRMGESVRGIDWQGSAPPGKFGVST